VPFILLYVYFEKENADYDMSHRMHPKKGEEVVKTEIRRVAFPGVPGNLGRSMYYGT
jgi:hypothetical protein